MLEKVVRAAQVKRDREAGQLEHVRREQQRLDATLQDILQQQDARQQQATTTKHGEHGDSSNMAAQHGDSSNIATSTGRQDNIALKHSSKTATGTNYQDNREKVDVSTQNIDLDVEIYLPGDKKKNSEEEVKSSGSKMRKKGKLLHKKEWVGVLEDRDCELGVESGMEALSVSGMEDSGRDLTDVQASSFRGLDPSLVDTDHMSDAELLAHHRRSVVTQYQDEQTSRSDVVPNNRLPSLDTDVSDLSDKPLAKSRTKKKFNYTPNTFVPNRTLQLRRTGSQSRLESAENTFKESPLEADMSGKDILPTSKSKDVSSRNQKPDNTFKSRPAFR